LFVYCALFTLSELRGSRYNCISSRTALRKGDWKIVKVKSPLGKDVFLLYHLKDDPLENNDLSEKFKDKHDELKVL